jgi:hypothetical protein
MHVDQVGDRLYLPSEPMQIPIDITQAALAGTQLACGLEQIGLAETTPEVHLSIHDTLDLGPLCEVGVGTCESVDVASLDPVELERAPIDRYRRVRAQCSRRGALVALVVEEQRLRCDPSLCRCAVATTVDSVITATSALPPWWPCGERIEYCDANGPIYLIDSACL